MGWVCGDDIDVSREEDEEQEVELKKSERESSKQESLEDEIGDGNMYFNYASTQYA